MRKHRTWTTIIGYFKQIPLDSLFVETVKQLLEEDKNILVLIKKEDHESNPKHTPEEKFKAICERFPNETKTGKMILSKVPDIVKFVEWEF